MPLVEQLNKVEMMELELPGQESLRPNCQQRVGVHLVVHNEFTIELNGIIPTD